MNLSQARSLFSTLSTTQICDAGKNVRVLDSSLIPYTPKLKMLGKAFTVHTEGDLLPVIRSLKEATDEHVIVLNSGNSPFAMAGEIFSSEAKRKNIAGIVIDGFCRDIEPVKQIGLPFYAKGVCAKAGTRMKLGQFNIPILCCGVTIKPGDIILGDENGVVAMNMQDLEEALEHALEINKREELVLKKIHSGTSLLELTNFEEHYKKIGDGEDSSFRWK